jgi:hypothetical protein
VIGDLLLFSVVLLIPCVMSGLLVLFDKRSLAIKIIIGLFVVAAVALPMGYVLDDPYNGIFALIIGIYAGVFALGALIGVGLAIMWIRKHG